jgi:hypothetical protein
VTLSRLLITTCSSPRRDLRSAARRDAVPMVAKLTTAPGEILSLRAERTNLLGYDSQDYKFETQ